MSRPLIVSTPIFYVNSNPHLGHAYTLILADAVLRWQSIKTGRPGVLFTGTDEHGNKVLQAAQKATCSPKTYCDTLSKTFRTLAERCGTSPFQFNRTTSDNHRQKVVNFWTRLEQKGAIYKGSHEGWYCVSEESFYPESRIKSEQCPETGALRRVTVGEGKPVEWVEESNYKFRLSEYLGPVREWLRKASPVQPQSRLNDLQEIFEDGLPDLSVSRSRASNPWGIPVPGDPDQTIYVWLDALSNYFTDPTLSRIPDVHVIGKDILKFHAVYWPAFLMAADLPLPKTILTHGHWSVGKTKMSKSIGNVVDPVSMIDEFGLDAVRYLLLRLSRVDGDSEYDHGILQKKYNLELANTLGNLVSRLANPVFYPTMKSFTVENLDVQFKCELDGLRDKVGLAYDENRFYLGIEHIMAFLGSINAKVNETKPWEAARDGRTGELEKLMPSLLFGTCTAVSLLAPIMPTFSNVFMSSLQFKLDTSLDVSGYHAALPSLQFPRLKIQ